MMSSLISITVQNKPQSWSYSFIHKCLEVIMSTCMCLFTALETVLRSVRMSFCLQYTQNDLYSGRYWTKLNNTPSQVDIFALFSFLEKPKRWIKHSLNCISCRRTKCKALHAKQSLQVKKYCVLKVNMFQLRTWLLISSLKFLVGESVLAWGSWECGNAFLMVSLNLTGFTEMWRVSFELVGLKCVVATFHCLIFCGQKWVLLFIWVSIAAREITTDLEVCDMF